jgi:hypothetical protein
MHAPQGGPVGLLMLRHSSTLGATERKSGISSCRSPRRIAD